MKSYEHFSGGLALSALSALISTACVAQTSKQDSIWLPLKVFIGILEGKGDGGARHG